MGTFKTKARAVELLGKKQIRDSVTALAEIMKNSYDADAELLRVDFLTKDLKSPCIVICDTGVGMNQADLEDKWLVLGTPSKLESKKKRTAKGRALMGEKGIGRLAVSRLGQQMWMFTKKVNTGWNVLYINWNIFENPDLFIQDIEIPVEYNRDLLDAPQLLKRLREIQESNLKRESWKLEKNIDKLKTIESQIADSYLDIELVYDFSEIIENSEKKQGTIIFCIDLNDDWERYLDKTKTLEEDVLATRNYNRLNAFLSDFAPNEEDFHVELFHNEEPLVFTAGFDKQDYELYDLKIEGHVEHGIFKGSIDARNGDRVILEKCNDILRKGIVVTSGIGDWRRDDCGKYTVKLCHFEMDKKNTGLTAEEFETIKKRMDKAGGIGVYRDNVRVLPYGEPENDFLELEERRSRSATYYLFSHRNMFGRIDITSSDNPHLEDKSSREGIIENQYYYYFIKTLQNLLIRISVDFLGDMNKDSFKLRKSYIDQNKQAMKNKQELQNFEKEQNKLFQAEKRRIEDLLKANPPLLSTLEQDVIVGIEHIRTECDKEPLIEYKSLLEQSSKIKYFLHEIENKLLNQCKQLYIAVNERYESKYPLQLLDDVDTFNEGMQTKIKLLEKRVAYVGKILQDQIDENIEHYHKEFSRKMGTSLESVTYDLNTYVNETLGTLQKLSNAAEDDIYQKQTALLNKAEELEEYKKEIYGFDKEFKSNMMTNYEKIKTYLLQIKRNISVINVSADPEVIQKIRIEIKECEEQIYKATDLISKTTTSKYEMANNQLNAILEKFQLKDSQLINQLIIQNNELKELNEMYADLANVGMAAEIVSHEFNQLFNNVYDAINQLKFQSMSGDGNYYLNQIDVGFRAISDRMNQLSPMYRSKSLYKKKINIYEMLQDIYQFFENRLINQGIEFVNGVDKNLELKISLSKIYPILSNLIYNSIYWVADRSEKQILIHYVEEDSALYVEDSGVGISIRNKERVFEPFFSLKKDGRGLGLSISKNVLESQGHQIEVVTNSKNKQLNGACFKITFNVEAKI
ncbi:MAG: ATP-binding protein [Lachnospiraceae bacterium]|nr:ATP-binding protein [Lachnospiraceae bacterium]